MRTMEHIVRRSAAVSASGSAVAVGRYHTGVGALPPTGEVRLQSLLTGPARTRVMGGLCAGTGHPSVERTSPDFSKSRHGSQPSGGPG